MKALCFKNSLTIIQQEALGVLLLHLDWQTSLLVALQ
jgi:hypothetical protein